MKYKYAYKTSDGVRHEDVIDAPSRDKAFETLRSKGIRPIKVVATDGSKENGEIRGIRKRVFIASLIFVAIIAGFAAHFVTQKGEEIRRLLPTKELVNSIPRHFISQNVDLHSHESDFQFESERFLLNFCIPARQMTDSVINLQIIASDLHKSLKKPITKSSEDSPTSVELKGMVVGLKNEASLIIKSGRSPFEALSYFVDRQKMEFEHRKRIIEQVQNGEMTLEAANSLFKSMGFEEIQ